MAAQWDDESKERLARLTRRVAYAGSLPVTGVAVAVGYVAGGSGGAVAAGVLALMASVIAVVVAPRLARRWASVLGVPPARR